MRRLVKEDFRLYAVTDEDDEKLSIEEKTELALKGGVTFVQLRLKHADREKILKTALRIRELTKKYDVPFVINDDVMLAKECDADGVHVGQEDMAAKEAREILGADKIIGVSAHNVEEAVKAVKDGADYIGCGAVFSTSTKAGTVSLSFETLNEICGSVDIPVVAIGGINDKNIELMYGTKPDGVAVVSAIFSKADIEQAARVLRAKSERIFGNKLKTVLSIAGSDPSGGAGIQADLKTFAAHKVYGMAAVTALTAQNTLGVKLVEPVSYDMVKLQLDAVFSDIYPDAVKIGMLANGHAAEAVAEILEKYSPDNVVVDTVMVSTSGKELLDAKAEEILKSRIFKHAALVTPNIFEAERLSGISIKSKEDMLEAARIIKTMTNAAVLIKGGHLTESADDLLYCSAESVFWYRKERILNNNTHGTGCTLSSAIAANLALGFKAPDSVKNAKEYISGAIEYGLDLGSGNGPLNHMYGM